MIDGGEGDASRECKRAIQEFAESIKGELLGRWRTLERGQSEGFILDMRQSFDYQGSQTFED